MHWYACPSGILSFAKSCGQRWSRIAPAVRATTVRHTAIIAAVVVTWCMRSSLHVGTAVLWALGIAAVTNVGMLLLLDRLPSSQFWTLMSSIVGIGAWAVLIALTGGVRSPLVAEFWVEIALAPLALTPGGVLSTVAMACAALGIQQCVIGIGASATTLLVDCGLLLAAGTLTYSWAIHASHRERKLVAVATDLGQRLELVEKRLANSETVGQLGERAGRLAHCAKSTVHSLKGFTSILEAAHLENPMHRRALDGLRTAIGQLEELSTIMLRPAAADTQLTRGANRADVARTLQDVVSEVQSRHEAHRWITLVGDEPCGVAIPSGHLREALLVLLENAAEASENSSEIVLQINVEDRMLRIAVRDHGPGISQFAAKHLFEPGITTKSDGNGFGLYFARRLVESAGGQLTAEPAQDGGTRFAMSLPIQES